MPRVLVLNGPNLQRLGTREPDVYGVVSLPEVAAALAAAAPAGVEVDLRQADDEATLIILTGAGLPGGEGHVTNPAAREAFRRESVVSPAATGVIAGFGADGYLLALDWVGKHLPAAG